MTLQIASLAFLGVVFIYAACWMYRICTTGRMFSELIAECYDAKGNRILSDHEKKVRAKYFRNVYGVK